MTLLSTLPRRSWLERTSIFLAAALIVSGLLSLAGWWLHLDAIIQPFAGLGVNKANTSLCILALGIGFLSIELQQRRLIFLALIPLVLTFLTLLEFAFKSSLGLDEFFATDRFVVSSEHPGRMAFVSAIGIFAASALLLSRLFWETKRTRILAEVVVGSLVGSIGLSTLLGYLADLPGVYSWGTHIPMAPVAAIDLSLIGLTLVFHAWRENKSEHDVPPEWLQVPAIIACLTLSFILWAGLREREITYVSAKTQTTMDSLATAINAELTKQARLFEILAVRWSQNNDFNPITMEADAATQTSDSFNVGLLNISWITPDLRTRWIYPPVGNEGAISFNHGLNPTRASALNEARDNKRTILSSTIDIVGRGKGVALYSPLLRDNNTIGFIGADFLYQSFFKSIATEKNLAPDYSFSVWIGGDRIYEARPNDGSLNAQLALDRTYTIFNRRVSLTLSPSNELLARERRYLPELALAAGFGITLLLGLSVHLARRARTGQLLAEHSNKKILLENEERRRVEARLKISDERLRLALDSTQIGIFEWNVPSSHVYYSTSLWAMFGYEHGRMPTTAETWQALIHPEDFPAYRQRIELQLQGRVSFIDPEYRVRHNRGAWRWVYMRSRTVATANGRPTRIIGTVQDITDRLETLQALRISQSEARKLSLVASKTDNPVLICSPSGMIEWVNESFTRVMEYPLAEVVGKTPADLMLGQDSDENSIQRVRTAATNGQAFSTDVLHYSKSGRKYYLHMEMQPVRNEAGELENFIVIETDITTRVETEQNLRRAKSEADAASRAKSEFLASMSHEIRTPMNGVIGMTSLLMETPLNIEQRDFVNTIRTSGETLLTILNDILDFSKIESGKMELEQLPFELALCIEEALDLFALQASAKHIELGYHIATDVPSWIIGDITRLRQIIINLINNAIKFTPSGSVSVNICRSEGESGGPFMLQFSVIDTGIGIPPDRVDRLFKAFSQVDSSTTRKYGGTGLGLAISQRLCSLMGGNISVESAVGVGSSFIFTIRTQSAVPSETIETLSTPERLIGATVVCVEPHNIAQLRLRSIFSLWRAECIFASSTAEALPLIQSLNPPPALLVLNGDETRTDLSLSELDSVQVPRLLMLPFGQIASSGLGEDPLTSTVFKPLKTGAVVYALGQLFQQVDRPAPALLKPITTGAPLAEEIPLDVLVVEDNLINQKVILRFLDRLGYKALAVNNGLDAIARLESHPYHLVWMDIQMPGIDGFEASRQIRRRIPASRQPKIIALTANAMHGDRELCLAAGMDDYISKPVKLPEIIAAIRKLFKNGSPLLQSEQFQRPSDKPREL